MVEENGSFFAHVSRKRKEKKTNLAPIQKVRQAIGYLHEQLDRVAG